MRERDDNQMWERKKLEVRKLEVEIESHLIQLEKMDVGTDPDHVTSLYNDAKSLIASLRQSARTLSDWAENDKGPLLRQQADRYQEVATEKDRALAQIFQSLTNKRNRSQLLDDVHHEMEEYAESHGARLLNQEADSISATTLAAQRLTDAALASHRSLENQASVLQRAGGRVGDIVGAIPGIDAVLGKIRNKRQRDTLVLGVLIAICLFLIWLFW
eukprot:TRINITY_DN8568_c0_g1_i2.p1 TRINITY_DN8568_c0_g1~~TRINITY_DN8568_c0_g1_i2.p1  ORF type:complete len:216 (+),score=46.37 TRINITY_DN8568_c0_g1_i2:38-685(+)